MMLSISPLMTLIALVILPISGMLLGFIMKHSQKYFIARQISLAKVNGHVEEHYAGQSTIRVYNAEEKSCA